MQVIEKVQNLVRDGYDFAFGDYISKAANLLTKNMLSFALFVLFSGLIAVFSIFIPVLGLLALYFVLMPALYAGAFLMARESDETGQTRVGTGFSGFNVLGKVLPVWLLMLVVYWLANIPYMIVIGPKYFEFFRALQMDPTSISDLQPPSAGPVSFLLSLIPMYFGIAYSFSLPFVLFKDLGAWEAMEASRKLITKKFFSFFAFLLVSALISSLGAFLLLIGLLFTGMFYPLAIYSAFDGIVGVEADAEDDLAGDIDHLIA